MEIESIARRRDVISRVINKEYAEKRTIVQKAYMFAGILLDYPVDIKRMDNHFIYNSVLRGMPDSQGSEQIEREREHIKKIYPIENCDEIVTAKEIGLLQRWAGGHTSNYLELLLTQGYQARIELVLKYLDDEKQAEKRDFYKAELIVLCAAQKQILRYANETDDNKIKSVCKNIAYNPPKNFNEAIQMIIFTMEFCVTEGNGGGLQGTRIDQLLYKYYITDIKKGILSREKALSMICSLWRFCQIYGERGTNFTLGGCDQYGRDMSNELTLICMEASMQIRADVPLLTLRVHPNLNEKVWETALKLVQCGQGFPAFYNDLVAVQAKRNAGVSLEDAYDYSTLGCVEITIGGREFSHTEGARINWLKILELMLFNGKCQITGKEWKLAEEHRLEDLTDFEQFYNWFKIELNAVIDKVADFIDKASMLYSRYWPTPYLSSITYGCIEKGSDITAHGTKYYNLSINCVGMANTVDSLEVIERLVFKEHKLSFNELIAAVKVDFNGCEEIRQMVLECPKYGNDVESVDSKMSDLMNFFTTTVQDKKMINNRGKFQCGFYSVMHHSLLGKLTCASCDGRHTRTALSNSLSPSQGMDENGPTAVLNSISKVSMEYMGNGGALDMKFLPSFFYNPKHVFAFKYMIETFFEMGGLEMQFNVVDTDTLIAAQKEPKKYQNLVVRVSGYSAYFVKLDKELQNEIIARTAMTGM